MPATKTKEIMETQEITVEDEVQRWKNTSSELHEAITANDVELKELQGNRRRLLLDAAQDKNGAGDFLTKLDQKMAKLIRDTRIKQEALLLAKENLALAEHAVAATVENTRTADMKVIAAEIMVHASAFTRALREANAAAQRLEKTITSLNEIATPAERSKLNVLYEKSPYLRALEYSGLRSVLTTIPAYPGLKEHILPLDEAMRIHLTRWLPSNDDFEEVRK